MSDSIKARLTRNERTVLEELARSDGWVRTGTLIYAVWNGLGEPESAQNIIRVHILAIRKKIAPYGLRIVSQPYSGYRLEVASPATPPF